MKRPPKKGISKTDKKRVLLIDGNALLKLGYHGAKNEYNMNGEHIGGLYQFLTITRKLLEKNTFHKTFTFWDGPMSGKLRWEIYKDYKGNRNKNFETGTFSQEEDLVTQKKKIWNYLEEVSIRQLENYVVESDDFIAYFCNNFSNEYDITICTLDRDLAQLISEHVKIYFCDLKQYVTHENYQEYFKHHQSNSMLIKMITGDDSDNIKGVKGVKEGTLIKYFPQLKERTVTLDEIIDCAKVIQAERVEAKKKPLKAIDNIIGGITDGLQGNRLYEINKALVDLKNPMLTKEAIIDIKDIEEFPINPEGRSIKNIHINMKRDGLDRLINEHRFPTYMLPFKKVMNKEKALYELWIKENN